MINDETRRKLREIQLDDMITILDQQIESNAYAGMNFEERVRVIVDYVYERKQMNQIKGLIKRAKFRLPDAEIRNIYYTKRKLDKELILELSTCNFIFANKDVIFQGFTGSGKSYLACALGKEACKQGIRTRYIRLPDLLEECEETKQKAGTTGRLLKKYTNYKLLILDEWLTSELSDDNLHFIFELSERRLDTGATMFCTQYKVENWHSRLGGGVMADSILDRIIHGSYKVYSGDLNMRELLSLSD